MVRLNRLQPSAWTRERLRLSRWLLWTRHGATHSGRDDADWHRGRLLAGRKRIGVSEPGPCASQPRLNRLMKLRAIGSRLSRLPALPLAISSLSSECSVDKHSSRGSAKRGPHSWTLVSSCEKKQVFLNCVLVVCLCVTKGKGSESRAIESMSTF